MSLAEIVQFINQQHGTAFRLVGRLPGGTRGAYAIAAPTGERAVLKRSTHPQRPEQLRRSILVVERLRSVGYPAPACLLTGLLPDATVYYVQEFRPGSPLEQMTFQLLEQVLVVNDLQAGHRLQTEQNWSRYVHDVVFAGESGWAAALRRHSSATAELLTEVEQRARPFIASELPNADIVHGDFGPDNVLVQDGRITAVIDLEAAGSGARAIDLAILLGWGYDEIAPPERTRLVCRIEQVAGPAGVAICLGYQILNMVAYAIEHHGPSGVARRVERSWQMLQAAEEVM